MVTIEKDIKNLVPDAFILIYNFTRCKRSAFNTTETELKAIRAPATHGASRPSAKNWNT